MTQDYHQLEVWNRTMGLRGQRLQVCYRPAGRGKIQSRFAIAASRSIGSAEYRRGKWLSDQRRIRTVLGLCLPFSEGSNYRSGTLPTPLSVLGRARSPEFDR